MTITKKPLPKKEENLLIDSIISKGGSSPATNEDNKNEHIKITLRLPHKMLDIIDHYLSQSISKKTRTSWLREAAEEKIDRDLNPNNKDL